ncbi:MAG: hypothetical protein COB85_08045, partial [Bacteroidetes bacterium]
ATGGVTPYTYLWDDPLSQASMTATGLSAGTYNVIVTDSNGCSGTASVTISEPSNLNTSITSTTNVTCGGGCDGEATVGVSGGTTPYTYLWNDPTNQTTATATGLCVGSYEVTVTDADGTSSIESLTIFQPSSISISTSTTDASCGNADGSATAAVTGGVPSYTYAWSSGGNLSSEGGLAAGNYSVTVTDSKGCSEIGMVTIANAGAPTVAMSSTDITCNGLCDGTVLATVTGGTTPYIYSWNDPSTSTNSSAAGLCEGTYTVLITDADGCLTTDSIDVVEPAALMVTTTANPASGGSCDGDITATPSGGTGSYTYTWSDTNSQTSQMAAGLCPGDYLVTVTDANGCTVTASDSVSTLIGIYELNKVAGIKVYPNPADNFISIEVSLSDISAGEIQLYNVHGEMIYRQSVGYGQNSTYVIDLSEYSNGIYFIKLETQHISIVKKVIINK